MGGVASSGVAPGLTTVDLRDQPEQPVVTGRETRVFCVQVADQIVFVSVLHPDLSGSRGRE